MASTVWKGRLSFGLVSVPIKLTSAARRESLEFHMLHKADKSRVKQVLHCALEDKALPRSEIVKGFEYAKDKYVEVEDAELAELAPKSAKTVEVVEFVKAQEVNALYLESSYYVAPGAAAGERAYALLYKALLASGYVGVAKIAMNNREHVVIVRAGKHGLLMHTMFYVEELRQVEEFRTDASAVKSDELAMALKLMQRMYAAFEPQKYRDEYRESVMRMVQEKVNKYTETPREMHKYTSEKNAGGETAIAGIAPFSGRLEPTLDITSALKRSLAREGVGSPAGSAQRRVHVSAKPHTNAHRDARGRFTGVGRAGGANGRAERQQRAMGDPLLSDGGRVSAPQRSSRSAVGTPNRRLCRD
jgi:DNA end-binding protein Ku